MYIDIFFKSHAWSNNYHILFDYLFFSSNPRCRTATGFMLSRPSELSLLANIGGVRCYKFFT